GPRFGPLGGQPRRITPLCSDAPLRRPPLASWAHGGGPVLLRAPSEPTGAGAAAATRVRGPTAPGARGPVALPPGRRRAPLPYAPPCRRAWVQRLPRRPRAVPSPLRSQNR